MAAATSAAETLILVAFAVILFFASQLLLNSGPKKAGIMTGVFVLLNVALIALSMFAGNA